MHVGGEGNYCWGTPTTDSLTTTLSPIHNHLISACLRVGKLLLGDGDHWYPDHNTQPHTRPPYQCVSGWVREGSATVGRRWTLKSWPSQHTGTFTTILSVCVRVEGDGSYTIGGESIEQSIWVCQLSETQERENTLCYLKVNVWPMWITPAWKDWRRRNPSTNKVKGFREMKFRWQTFGSMWPGPHTWGWASLRRASRRKHLPPCVVPPCVFLLRYKHYCVFLGKEGYWTRFILF